jgi:hypothetical protein
MKRQIILAIGLIFSGVFFDSCKKADHESTDFRNKFTGRYQVTERINCYGLCGTCSSLRDTVIAVNIGLTDSTLNVLGRDVYLDSTGHYYSYHYGLRLWNDSIPSGYMNGGLGCGQYETYIGFRISNTP